MEKIGVMFNNLAKVTRYFGDACHRSNVMVKPLKIVTWNANRLNIRKKLKLLFSVKT